jgi:hypothetical protein
MIAIEYFIVASNSCREVLIFTAQHNIISSSLSPGILMLIE